VEWSDWSPDGTNLLVVRTVGNENRIEYPLGKVIYKVAGRWISHPRISRDGKRIAFCEHGLRGDDRGSVTIIDSDGGGTAKSFGSFSSLYGLAWSPKGDEVWFTADPTTTTIARRLMAVTMSGAFRLLAAAPGDLTLHDVSADGTAIIAIDDRERKIFFSGSPGTGSQATGSQVEDRELTWLDRAVLLALSLDGKQVLFTEAGKGGGSLGTIFLRKTDGTAAVRLGEGYASALSPDQKWVLAFTETNPRRRWLIPTGAGEVTELKVPGVENIIAQGFAADSRRVVLQANEPGHPPREYLFDPASNQLQPLTPEGVRGVFAAVTPDGKFLVARGEKGPPELVPVELGSSPRELKGWLDKDRPIQITADGTALFVANFNGMTASIYRLRLDNGTRQLIKTLEMHDPAGGFGITRVVTTPDGLQFAYNTLRQLSELYLLQGLN
jgi:Tol biopolymer transport system component